MCLLHKWDLPVPGRGPRGQGHTLSNMQPLRTLCIGGASEQEAVLAREPLPEVECG